MSNDLIVKEDQPSHSRQVVSQPMRLIEMALSNNADIDKLERLMEMQRQWDERDAKKQFLDALGRFQSQCPTIRKMKQGHNYKYAPLADIIEQVKGVIASCGLSYRFEQDHSSGIRVTCVISHSAGHSETNSMVAMADTSGSKNAIQAIGSTVQYLMRYTFVGGFGITTADEDIDCRMPQKPEPQIDDVDGHITAMVALQGREMPQFFEWASKLLKRQIASLDDITEPEKQGIARKLEATK